jgi:amidase
MIAYETATAVSLAAALRRREVSSVELVDAAIARIEAMDGAINAVVVRDFDKARAAAKAADGALAAGQAGALLGVPGTVKESYDLEGFPSTWGITAFKDHRATEDSEVVRRLKGAGGIILGKTNVPPALAEWFSANPIYGRTNNPHDLSRSPGGSSGGSAAALAAGFSAFEMGSDIGGSIRIPAAFCGVYGHKPSYGIVPMTGHGPGGLRSEPPPLACGGPLARSAEDLDALLGIVAGPDGDAARGYSLNLPAPRHARVGDYRVLILDSHPRCGTSSDLVAAIHQLASKLEGQGAKVTRFTDQMPDLGEQFDTYLSMLLTITTRRAGGEPERPPISSHRYMDLLDNQFRARQAWAALFRQFDVVIAPTFSTCAIPHNDEPDWGKRSLMIDGEATPYGRGLVWPSVALLPNLPATAMPIGLGKEGLPISAQIIAPYLEDRTGIAFAGLCAGLV